jgi:molecular chaperone HscB
MNLQSTDFEIFGIPARFAQDQVALDGKWKDLQREAHPDKFVSQGAAAQRVAMQWSVRINEAYQRLKDPLKRASYLCELNGAPINAERNTAMPTEFLLQQIAWHEALDDANSVEEVEQIACKSNQYKVLQLLKIEQLIDVGYDFSGAASEVRSLMFIERFQTELEARIDQLGQ